MWVQRFFPQQTDFFAYFTAEALCALEAARLLHALFAGREDQEQALTRLHELEERVDAIGHEVYSALRRTLIPELSYTDIRTLTGHLDDVIDHIEDAGQRVMLYRLLPATASAARFTTIIVQQAEFLVVAVPLIAGGAHRVGLQRHVAAVHRLEWDADDELNQVLADLYAEAVDLPTVVRAKQWGEVYTVLEETTDRAVQMANTLQGIMDQRA